DLFCQALREKKQTLKGNILSERNQMHFVVSGNLVAKRVQKAGAVGRPLTDGIDIPDKEISFRLLCDVLHSRSKFRVFGQIERRRRFRPYDQSRFESLLR